MCGKRNGSSIKRRIRRNKKKRVGFEADSQTVGINRTETGMKIEPVFKNKKLVTIPKKLLTN